MSGVPTSPVGDEERERRFRQAFGADSTDPEAAS